MSLPWNDKNDCHVSTSLWAWQYGILVIKSAFLDRLDVLHCMWLLRLVTWRAWWGCLMLGPAGPPETGSVIPSPLTISSLLHLHICCLNFFFFFFFCFLLLVYHRNYSMTVNLQAARLSCVKPLAADSGSWSTWTYSEVLWSRTQYAKIVMTTVNFYINSGCALVCDILYAASPALNLHFMLLCAVSCRC